MIVVTGATGNIGKALVEQLAASGAKYRVVARDPAKASKSGGEVVKGDLSDPKSLEAAFKGADELFLLAAAGPDMSKMEKNAIDAAKKAGVKHVVLLSTAGADEKSPVKLAQWHAASEKALKDSGLKWTILQPNYFMQNLFSSAPTIKGDGAFYAPLNDGKVAMVDARDIAAVAAKALTTGGHEGKTYYVSGPAALPFADLAAIFTKKLGKTVKYVNVPPADFKKSLLSAGIPEWFASDFVALYGAFAQNYGAQVSTTVKDVTGKPARDVESFIGENVSAFK